MISEQTALPTRTLTAVSADGVGFTATRSAALRKQVGIVASRALTMAGTAAGACRRRQPSVLPARATGTDRHFRVPSMRIPELHAAYTLATFSYVFTWKSPAWDGKLGAAHEVNTPIVFGTFDAPDSRDLVPANDATTRLAELEQRGVSR